MTQKHDQVSCWRSHGLQVCSHVDVQEGNPMYGHQLKLSRYSLPNILLQAHIFLRVLQLGCMTACPSSCILKSPHFTFQYVQLQTFYTPTAQQLNVCILIVVACMECGRMQTTALTSRKQWTWPFHSMPCSWKGNYCNLYNHIFPWDIAICMSNAI